MKTLTQILQVLFFLILSNSIFCQDYYWQGGNGLWNDAQMWYPSGIPQANDEVFIAKGTVNVDNGYSAAAKFVEIHSTGGIKVHQSASLTVVGNTDEAGILNYGNVETYGAIESNGHSGSLYDGVGFRNYGKFYIYSQGSYSSTGCESYALLNEQYGICSNDGSIEIVNNGSGIRNHSKFTNSNTIEIDNMDTSHGITNHGNFSNETGSIIQMQGYTHFGIISSEMGALNQIPEFVNNGKIHVTDSEWWCITIWDGTFTNLSKGDISVLESGNSGLAISAPGTFKNFGSFETYNNTADGIRGIGTIINKGFIKSSFNGSDGLHFYDLGTSSLGSLVNHGEIQMYGNTEHDILIEGDLHNTDEGYIYTENLIEGTEIINDGIFSTWYNGNHNITFENNGVVEDVYNSMPNIQNNQIRIRPLDGPLVANQVFFDALDKASSSNTTISFGWFDQLNNGNAAALYFFWTNSIYPNAFGASASTLYMDATIQSSGLKIRLRANVLNSSAPLVQNQENDAIHMLDHRKSPEFNIYPNPIVNTFKVDATSWSDEIYTLRLYDTSGKEILSESVKEFESINLPYVVKDGMYIGILYDGNKIVYKKKLVVARGNLIGREY